MQNPLQETGTQESLTMISKQIKTRLERAGKRFYAADNISEFMHEGDHEELIEELTDKFQGVLESLVIDVDNDPNSIDTSRRLAKMYINEIMSGRYNDMPKVTSFPNEGQYDQLIIVRSDIKSMCSHHHQPVTGICYIACLPGDKVIGLSKYTRIAQHLAQRGQLQEELTEMIATEIEMLTQAPAVGVYIRARHGCCENRGIRSSNSSTQTTVLKGALKTDAALRNEFMHNIQIQEHLCG
jgi:GTP cyclohydrolase IA